MKKVQKPDVEPEEFEEEVHDLAEDAVDAEDETESESESNDESEEEEVATKSNVKPTTKPTTKSPAQLTVQSTEQPAKKKREDGPPPKPMTEEDVMEVISKLSSLDAKDINEIIDGYAQGIKGLISYIKKKLNVKTDEDDIVELDRLMRLINMCPKDDLFIRSKDKIWHARYHILDRDAEWFMNRDYGSLIKKDQKQRMIETMIRMIRSYWKKLNEDEHELYWEKAFEILNLVARFKKLTNEA